MGSSSNLLDLTGWLGRPKLLPGLAARPVADRQGRGVYLAGRRRDKRWRGGPVNAESGGWTAWWSAVASAPRAFRVRVWQITSGAAGPQASDRRGRGLMLALALRGVGSCLPSPRVA